MKSLRIAILILSATAAASASDRDFKGVVRAIEHSYGVHHMHIPFLGVALFFARPEGVSGVHLAVFENFEAPTDAADVSRVIESSLGPKWYPFVRVHSTSNGETTLIYTNPTEGRMRMMIVNIEPSEATVVEVNLSDRAVEGWIKEPGESAKGSNHHPWD